MYDRDLLVSTLSGFIRALRQPHDVDVVLQDLVERVTSVLRLAGSGVMLGEHDRLVCATSAPDRVAALDETEEARQLGPCVRACRSHEVVAVPDLSAHTQEWGPYCATAESIGIQAVAVVPMCLNDTVFGALSLYSTEVRQWSDNDLAIAEALADMATCYLYLGQQELLNEQLQHALESRVVIEQAKGILAASHGISVEAAFELLRTHARSHNASVQVVADAVVHVGLEL